MRTSRTLRAAALSALAGASLLSLGAADAQDGGPDVKAGLLKCNVSSGWGFIFGSSKDLKCLYSPLDGAAERYRGEIEKYGIDIGYTQSGVLIWTVFAPTADLQPGALEGNYVGATAEVTAGIGLGANVLLGGGESIALQPLSVSGQEGLNIAAGIGAVNLKSAQ